MIRTLDIILSVLGLAALSPLMLVLWLAVVLDSPGGGFYGQTRTGRGGRPFTMWKFRTMHAGTDSESGLTVGGDPRITRVGKLLRRTKLDELPQLWNVLRGSMSIVGPRPELPRYTALYTPEQRKVLSVRPGMTDYASIKYADEEMLLAASDDPEKVYVEKIMPDKLRLNRLWIENPTAGEYFRIIFATVAAIWRHR